MWIRTAKDCLENEEPVGNYTEINLCEDFDGKLYYILAHKNYGYAKFVKFFGDDAAAANKHFEKLAAKLGAEAIEIDAEI